MRTRETDYLAKLSSEPGASGATAEGESENTSTSSPPEEGGGPAGAGGAAPRPRRSADGEGVDWKTRKERVIGEPSGTPRPRKYKRPSPPPTAPTRLLRASGQHVRGDCTPGSSLKPTAGGSVTISCDWKKSQPFFMKII